MNKKTLKVYDTCTGKYVDIEVSTEIYEAYMRTGWNIHDNNESFYEHEIQFSALIGGKNDCFENFHEFVTGSEDTIETSCKNTLLSDGDKAKYLVHDCHDAIIDRDTYNRAQQEIAKRSSVIKRSDKTKTDHGKYSSIYALSELLICGECGSSYRRVTWNVHGKKSIVWRCINRLDHGTRYCKDSPSIHEDKLHAAIAKAMNKVYTGDSEFMSIVDQNIESVLSEADEIGQAISKMESRIKEIEKQRDNLIELVTIGAMDIEASDGKFKALKDEESYLRQQILQLKEQAKTSDDLRHTLSLISEELKRYGDSIIEYDDIAVRKVIDCIKVMSKTKIIISFKGGFEMEADIEP